MDLTISSIDKALVLMTDCEPVSIIIIIIEEYIVDTKKTLVVLYLS